jgi:hypothetical protein
MPHRAELLRAAGKRYALVSRFLIQASSGSIAITAATPTSTNQNEGPLTFAAGKGGLIRVKNMWVSVADASQPSSTPAGVYLLDGSYGIQLAGSSSGPYTTILAWPFTPASNQFIASQGLLASVTPAPETADVTAYDWNPVQQDFAPSWRTFFFFDSFNSDSGTHHIVVTTSVLIEEYMQDTRAD